MIFDLQMTFSLCHALQGMDLPSTASFTHCHDHSKCPNHSAVCHGLGVSVVGILVPKHSDSISYDF